MAPVTYSPELVRNVHIACHDAGNSIGILDSIAFYLKGKGHPASTLDWFTGHYHGLDDAFSKATTAIPKDDPGPAIESRREAARLTISAIDRFLEDISRDGHGLPQRESTNAIRSVKMARAMLSQVVDLDFSISPHRDNVDINQLLREELASKSYTDRHGRPVSVSIRLASVPAVWGNPDLLRRVIGNLREDASIHPDSVGKLRLHVTSSLNGKGYVVLRFISAGAKPLSDDLIRKIGYSHFSSRQDPQETHGWGKISARQIIEAHTGMAGSFRARNFRGSPALEMWLPVS